MLSKLSRSRIIKYVDNLLKHQIPYWPDDILHGGVLGDEQALVFQLGNLQELI